MGDFWMFATAPMGETAYRAEGSLIKFADGREELSWFAPKRPGTYGVLTLSADGVVYRQMGLVK